MLTIPDPYDRPDTLPADAFERHRLSLPAIGLFGWLVAQPPAGRLRSAAMARFGVNGSQLRFVTDELARAGLLQAEASGS